MHDQLRELFTMFYPLDREEQRRWAAMLALPETEYVLALARESDAHGLRQATLDGAVAWIDDDGHQLMLLFRVSDPRDLSAIRTVYDTIAMNDAPLAYTFVQQLPDGEGTWDIFHMSRLSYLALQSGLGTRSGVLNTAAVVVVPSIPRLPRRRLG